ncbi:MAG: 2-oxoglutarate dehydrogenase E1 component [bacterium]|jgi:2-oxoglutarate dehydrogenase E1 component|nr:2-oxoglutarate dehydrogenase E1 component [bacterium]
MSPLPWLHQAEPRVVDAYYQQYLSQPETLPADWRRFFEGFEFARQAPEALAAARRTGGAEEDICGEPMRRVREDFARESRVLALIDGYRLRGHLFTRTNPVRSRRPYRPPLDPETFGLEAADLDRPFHAGSQLGLGTAPLREIIAFLEETYCRSVGVEFRYIRHPVVLDWLQQRMEGSRNQRSFAPEERRHVYRMLTRTVLLEKLLHTRFTGQKRFSIEGVDAVIPALDAIIGSGAKLGIEEFVIGMPHRGRLNVLVNVMGKPLAQLFAEFQDLDYEDVDFTNDVKYHLGYSSDRVLADGRRVHLSLAPNPSHLEAVDPVVEGIVRAKLLARHGGDESRIAPLLIHGDAAIAGQGIVAEVLQMSRLPGYRTGGTIHLVLNNQVGFTTGYLEGRSSTYCTDLAKTTLSPVFHVNGDDVEAVIHAVGLALEFRQEFKRDVFIDILGYRKHGHNEGDEPRFTQPLLYEAIARHPDALTIYRRQLVEQGQMSEAEAGEIERAFRAEMEEELAAAARMTVVPMRESLGGVWRELRRARDEDFEQVSPATGLADAFLLDTGRRLLALPGDRPLLPKAIRLYEQRRTLLEEGRALDWALGEALAFGTLLREGHPVRLSGQDSVRGTFSHRHAALTIADSAERWIPLANLEEGQAPFTVLNSPLSEYGVLGFDYGYSVATPDGLTIWEAQFGDFANGAQIIFDQFISCAETKWHQHSGLVCLLPHGYEGQGHEHSSARPERFLQLCAGANLQVANATTPANFFHLLRRQLKRPFRVPLIVLSPKSLLRHPAAVSPLADFGPGTAFRDVLDDEEADPGQVRRVLLCSGKLYYELDAARREGGRRDLAILRLEQLAPLPTARLAGALDRWSGAERWIWVQEEPENMGAWSWLQRVFRLRPLELVSRRAAAATATGMARRHRAEQRMLIDRAFA